ncbi:unnamed protein product [Symbiodinium natans]|uniref:Uncharacterized protein n=1 Tax=Symbiodinium natans TaxID=878477 RepID=A0A812S3V5_9DINO|nr:unnamed protein product [Symbiodinium natans]
MDDDMQKVLSAIRDIYSAGAVEGYSPLHQQKLRDLYKQANKVSEATTLEVRCKAVPVPKGATSKAKGPGKGGRGAKGAPAAELRRHALAALADLPEHLQPPALRKFASAANNSNNSERDLLRTLKKFKRVLPLTVDSFVSRTERVQYIKLGTWFRYLFNVRSGGQLIGGFAPTDHYAHVCLRAFWQAFRREHPSHAVCELHGERLHKVVPYALHLDEGRGLRKSAVLVVHAQGVFGADTAQLFRDRISTAADLGHQQLEELMTTCQTHNGKGSSYLSRMLFTCLPKASYTKKKSHVYDQVLERLREECTSLLEDGLTMSDGSTFYFALVAVKGVPESPEVLFMRDPFHVYKQCIGGYYVASCIVLLAEMQYWGSPGENSFDMVMDRMFQDFAYFVKYEFAGRVINHIKHFTKTNFHYPRTRSFPYMRPKGGDIMLLTRWLRHAVLYGPRDAHGVRSGSMITNCLEAQHVPFLQNIIKASSGAMKFFHIVHNNGLWHPRQLAKELGEACFDFCDAYCDLAYASYKLGLARYNLVPSLHYYHHFYVDVKIKLADSTAAFIASPSIANCECDEDYIGKISRLSRHVHASVTNERSIHRFLVKMHYVYMDREA